MQQVKTIMQPAPGSHQPYLKGPYRTPVCEVPRTEPDAANICSKHAPSAILTGEAGCNLVLSRLQSWGMPAQPAMSGLAYDLIADVRGLDLLRIQVKTRSKPKGARCSFVMTRGYHYSKSGMFRYADNDYDIAAFVCLALNQVFFCIAPIHRISVRTDWLRSPGIDRETFDLALSSFERRRHTAKLAWLASMTPDMPAALSDLDDVQTYLAL